MVKTIIPAFPAVKRTPKQDGSKVLKISECFTDTVQGEGITAGVPATFLRLQNCTLACTFCDTLEVWRKGNQFSVNELLYLWREKGIHSRLEAGHHLVITGGSPLLQDEAVLELLQHLSAELPTKLFVEIENEAVLMPLPALLPYVTLWNNSPKLSNSGMRKDIRYQPDILTYMSTNTSSIFKFVITGEEDWEEILADFIQPGYIKKEQVVLMPEGSSRVELQNNYSAVTELACKHSVKMCDRLQVTIFDKTVGV